MNENKTIDIVKHIIILIITSVGLYIYCNHNLEIITFKQAICDTVIILGLIVIIFNALKELIK